MLLNLRAQSRGVQQRTYEAILTGKRFSEAEEVTTNLQSSVATREMLKGLKLSLAQGMQAVDREKEMSSPVKCLFGKDSNRGKGSYPATTHLLKCVSMCNAAQSTAQIFS
ncbi:hypothetical protein TNCT_77831 [Trichonephila clavata]|uniref:Uncharacterized protein n=1 Tax=Trichonephila clavata TaxID=2740835 RepID=A0A8X6M3H2_TRICU|nr:hypothetical protein TNCT_77831 [Trichonephila clavata]